jgi:tol-pal system protein YbgF
MRRLFLSFLAASIVSWHAPAFAQSRQDLQILADFRQLEERVGRMQLALNNIGEAVKALTAKVDQGAEANVKTFANHQAQITQITSTLSTLREKLDNNSVRVSELAQEFSSVREGLRLLTDQINALVSLLQPAVAPVEPAAPGAPGSPGDATQPGGTRAPLGAVNLPPSSNSLYESAMGDYLAGRFDLAIEGFREVVKLFPTAPAASRAQLKIGDSFYQKKMCREAVPEFQKVMSDYRDSEAMPDALFLQGVCYSDLGRRTDMQRVFEQLIKQYPDTAQALQARQRLDPAANRR